MSFSPYLHRVSMFQSPVQHRRSGSAPGQLSSPQMMEPSFAGIATGIDGGAPMSEPFFPRTVDDLMRANALAFETFQRLEDETSKKNFLETVFSRDNKTAGYKAQDQFEKGLEAMRDCLRQFKTFVSDHEIHYKNMLDRVNESKKVVQQMDSITIPRAQALKQRIEDIKNDSKPEKIDAEWLKLVCCHKEWNVVRSSSLDTAYNMFGINEWKDIEDHEKEACIDMLAFLDVKDYHRSKSFEDHMQYYKSLGILPNNFPMDKVLRDKKRYNKETCHGLLGIYLGMLPEDAQHFIFVCREKQGEYPWVSKDPTAAAAGAGATNTGATTTTNGVATTGVATTGVATTGGAFPAPPGSPMDADNSL